MEEFDWRQTKRKKLATLIALIFAYTNISYGIAAFTIDSPATIDFPTKNVSNNSQTSQIIATSVTLNDDRAGSPGWTVTVNSTHLTVIQSAMKSSGNNDTVTSSGSYDGTLSNNDEASIYVLTITTGGAVGTAKFDVSDAETDTDITTGAQVSIGTKGVLADFDTATYQTSDQWIIPVDVHKYSDITVTPGTITANIGSLTGVTTGSSEALSGTGATSNNKTIMSATAGNGTGNYSQDVTFDLNIHPRPLSGTPSGVITFIAL